MDYSQTIVLILKHQLVKNKIKFKLLTGIEEKLIDKDLQQTVSMVIML